MSSKLHILLQQKSNSDSMQQVTDWHAVRCLALYNVVNWNPAVTVNQRPARLRHCQARKGGQTYYENYLRNRKEWGGEILGPPLQLDALQLQQKTQQQQQQQSQTPHRQQQCCSGTEAVSNQQQQRKQERPDSAQQLSQVYEALSDPFPVLSATTSSFNKPNSPVGSQNLVPDPDRFKLLLKQCLLATAPGPVHLDTVGHQAFRALASADIRRPPEQQQQPRQPWQFKDYVPHDRAHGVLLLLKPRRGVTLEPPSMQPVAPLVPVPHFHANNIRQVSGADTIRECNKTRVSSGGIHDSTSSYGSSCMRGSSDHTNATSNSSSNGGSNSPSSTAAFRGRVLHVFWDVSSAHPGGLDPRVVVARLKAVLGCYGHVAGIYAYGVQKMFSWVPEAFMLQCAPERLPGRNRRNRRQLQQQQEQEAGLEQQLQAALGPDMYTSDSLGPLRCPACGKLRSNYQQLHLHMVQRHKQPAPPLAKLLPAGAIAAASAAVAAGPGRNNLLDTVQGEASRLHWQPVDAIGIRNNGTRTLGRVSCYYNSEGHLFVPPDGHQISLKYVLLREGVDVRLVQNQKRAIDVSMAHGVQQLSEQLLGKDAQSAQQTEDVVVVISDRGAHAKVLQRLQRAGMGVIAVCRRVKQYKGAGVSLRWQWVVNGRYECKRPG